jgi:hypothetical protein
VRAVHLGPALLLALPLCALACSSGSTDVTSVVVQVEADPGILADTHAVHIEVFGATSRADASNATLRRELWLAADDPTPTPPATADVLTLTWPIRLVLAPLEGDASRVFRVRATAVGATGDPIAKVQILSAYRQGEALEIPLRFEDACRDTLCTPDTTCRTGTCTDDWLEPGTQPAPVDAGTADAGAEDAGPDDATAPDASEPDDSRKPPPRPAQSDPGDDVGPRMFALFDMVLSQDDGCPTIGYDIDGYQTVSNVSAVTDGHECVPPREHDRRPMDGWSEERPPEVPLDSDDGIDNEFCSAVWPFFETTFDTLSSSGPFEHFPFDDSEVTFQSVMREDHQSGRATWLLLVQGWNGQPNDTNVTVALVHAAAGTPCAYRDAVHFDEDHHLVLSSDPSSPAPGPNWDEDDCFWIRNDSFVPSNGTELAQEDDLAYVADGTLVMRLRDREAMQLFAGPSALLTAIMSASSSTPFLMPCNSSPAPGRARTRKKSVMSATATSFWPAPTVSTSNTS